MKSFPQFVIDSMKAIAPDWAINGVKELGRLLERAGKHIKAGTESVLESIEKYLNTSMSNLSPVEKCIVG